MWLLRLSLGLRGDLPPLLPPLPPGSPSIRSSSPPSLASPPSTLSLPSSPSLAAIHAALSEGPPLGASDGAWWSRVAQLTRDVTQELASPDEDTISDASRVSHDLVATLQRRSSPLYPIAKLSLKRNGSPHTARGSARILAELSLLSATFEVLRPHERVALLSSLRPLALTLPTPYRLPGLLIVCRGFNSPGSAHSWRRGRASVRQRVNAWAAEGPKALGCTIEPLVGDVASHSMKLRAAHSLLHLPLQVRRGGQGGGGENGRVD